MDGFPRTGLINRDRGGTEKGRLVRPERIPLTHGFCSPVNPERRLSWKIQPSISSARSYWPDEIQEVPDDTCTNPDGHSWTYTGTAYGGDDTRWSGEGRCFCAYCGADGDA